MGIICKIVAKGVAVRADISGKQYQNVKKISLIPRFIIVASANYIPW